MSRKFVATAAHCIITAKLKDILVYLGELDTQDTGKVKEFAPAELHRVCTKTMHLANEKISFHKPLETLRKYADIVYLITILEILSRQQRQYR